MLSTKSEEPASEIVKTTSVSSLSVPFFQAARVGHHAGDPRAELALAHIGLGLRLADARDLDLPLQVLDGAVVGAQHLRKRRGVLTRLLVHVAPLDLPLLLREGAVFLLPPHLQGEGFDLRGLARGLLLEGARVQLGQELTAAHGLALGDVHLVKGHAADRKAELLLPHGAVSRGIALRPDEVPALHVVEGERLLRARALHRRLGQDLLLGQERAAR